MKQFKILVAASLVFVVCIAVAYHNTASLGYGRQYIIVYDSQGVDIMDWHIDYYELKEKYESFKDSLPDSFVTI